MLDVECIDAQIAALLDDWQVNEHLRHDAETARDRAHAAEESACAVIDCCTDRIDADAAEICRLREERAAIPDQRQP